MIHKPIWYNIHVYLFIVLRNVPKYYFILYYLFVYLEILESVPSVGYYWVNDVITTQIKQRFKLSHEYNWNKTVYGVKKYNSLLFGAIKLTLIS